LVYHYVLYTYTCVVYLKESCRTIDKTTVFRVYSIFVEVRAKTCCAFKILNRLIAICVC